MRALYRWRVKPGQEEDFVRVWQAVTAAIRASVPGARGSMLLRSREDPSIFVATARWDSFEQWQAARAATERPGAPNPQAENAEFLGGEPLDEVSDMLDYGE